MQNCLPGAERKFLRVVGSELLAVLTHATHNTKEGRYDISSRLNLEHSSILCNPSTQKLK